MNDFIEKNERFLRLCCNVTRFFGLLLLFFAGIIGIGIPLSGWLWGGWSTDECTKFLPLAPQLIVSIVFPAIFLLGIEQFMRCLVKVSFKPSWILRFGDKIIYLCVILIFMNLIHRLVLIKSSLHAFSQWTYLQTAVIMAIPIFVKMLLLVVLGVVLRRIMPIIEESKTLV